MKLKTLAAMCKREGAFYLFDRMGEDGEIKEQWLGTHGASYPLSGLPWLTEENLITLFDITEKQSESIRFQRTHFPPAINFDHSDDGETMLEPEKLTLGYGGEVVRPVITSGGLEFIKEDYFSPLADIEDEIQLFERRTADGAAYFAVKLGFMIVAVIMPFAIIEEKFVENMEAMAVKCRTALNTKRERERRREAEEPEQFTFQGDAVAPDGSRGEDKADEPEE